jgi:hypothetical protein
MLCYAMLCYQQHTRETYTGVSYPYSTDREEESVTDISEAAMTTHSINETNPGKRVVTG